DWRMFEPQIVSRAMTLDWLSAGSSSASNRAIRETTRSISIRVKARRTVIACHSDPADGAAGTIERNQGNQERLSARRRGGTPVRTPLLYRQSAGLGK